MKTLPWILSAIAGMVDLTGFLTLGKVFTAHVTGNLVLMAAGLSHGQTASRIQLLIVSVFVLAVGGAWFVARMSRRHGASPVRSLLWCQFLLLACVLILGQSQVVAAVLAACAMGCQFALIRLELPGSPSTAVMTGNVTDLVLGWLDTVAGSRSSWRISSDRLKESAQVLAGFVGGCVIAGFAVSWINHGAWVLPAALAAAALPISARR
jgi:uncharacterized membrane protein YoaK (UPF0700 family)